MGFIPGSIVGDWRSDGDDPEISSRKLNCQSLANTKLLDSGSAVNKNNHEIVSVRFLLNIPFIQTFRQCDLWAHIDYTLLIPIFGRNFTVLQNVIAAH